jgi:hypothetical protein
MRKTLHHGPDSFEILGKHDTVMKFRDIPSAVAFLRRFRSDPMQMAVLRLSLSAHSIDTDRMDEGQILARFAGLLVAGKAVMVRSVNPGWGAFAQTEAEEEKPETTKAAPPPANTGWVEINLKNEKGTPIAGERYRIKLPNGLVQEGTLDDFGHAEYYQINRGSCEVSFPDLEDEEWIKL